MREGDFGFASLCENWSANGELSWSAFCGDCLIEVLKSMKIPDRKIGKDADEFVFWGLFIKGATKGENYRYRKSSLRTGTPSENLVFMKS